MALFRVMIVSGTPSCNLSSMAVAPNSLEQRYQWVIKKERVTTFSATQQLNWQLSILFSKQALSWQEYPSGIKLSTLCLSTDAAFQLHTEIKLGNTEYYGWKREKTCPSHTWCCVPLLNHVSRHTFTLPGFIARFMALVFSRDPQTKDAPHRIPLFLSTLQELGKLHLFVSTGAL